MTENIIPVSIEEKMKESYLNYSLSVIIGRALPDVRDGLKPVHRRILFGCNELGLSADKPHKKSARIIGEVLGKYHPHGDNALYNALVRLAQPFNQRYPLIDGHGNFGSIDGDSAAAMRYTEARLTPIARELLTDLKYETVTHKDNFDGTLQEPEVLPAAYPNLLVNGSSGIAVGMSTDIPPHNLREVTAAAIALLENPELNIEDLTEYIKGPDFPTGGKIIGEDSIMEAYQTGNSSLVVRGSTRVERNKGRRQLIITEIPFQINKSKLLTELTKANSEEKLQNVTTIRDESDQHGLRIVLELKRGADPELIKNRIFKHTSLQTNLRVNMLALLGKKPLVMNLKDILNHFIDFRRETTRKRLEYLLAKDQEKLEILSGLKVALDNLDKIIAIIRVSDSRSEARDKLIRGLEISEAQAKAILEMRLHRLVKMEQQQIIEDYNEVKERISYYQGVLADDRELDRLIIREMEEISEKYGDERKTEIISDEEKASIDRVDLIKNKEVFISFSRQGLLKKTDSRDNLRAAKNDHLLNIMQLESLDSLLFFTHSGFCFLLPVHDITEHHGLSTGDHFSKFISLPPREEIVGVVPLNQEVKNSGIVLCTENGLVKSTSGSEYQSSITKIKAINLEDNDRVVDCFVSEGTQEIILGANNGRLIRVTGEEISPSGRNTKGYRSMKLREGEKVVFGQELKEEEFIVLISSSGRIAKIETASLSPQGRHGRGRQVMHKNHTLNYVFLADERDILVLEDGENSIFELNVADLTCFNTTPVSRTQTPPDNFSAGLKNCWLVRNLIRNLDDFRGKESKAKDTGNENSRDKNPES